MRSDDPELPTNADLKALIVGNVPPEREGIIAKDLQRGEDSHILKEINMMLRVLDGIEAMDGPQGMLETYKWLQRTEKLVDQPANPDRFKDKSSRTR